MPIDANCGQNQIILNNNITSVPSKTQLLFPKHPLNMLIYKEEEEEEEAIYL